MDNKTTGFIIIGVAVLLAIVLVSFTAQLNELLHAECVTPEGFCPHEGSLPPQSYIGFTIVLILGIFGLYLVITGRSMQKISLKEKENIQKAMNSLSGDDKTVYEAIVQEGGTIFQSELMEKTGMSKVTISRVLDGLEGKGLIERRRRGMANVIILKHS